MDETALVALAQSQHGLVTVKQARRLGATPDQVKHRVSCGAWSRVRKGVLAIGAPPITWKRDVMAACLAGGRTVSASHRTAARMWEFVARSGRIEILAAEGRPVELTGVTAHRSYLFPPVDRCRLDNIPVTSAARTIVDLAHGHHDDVIGIWIDDALRRRLMTLTELRDCVGRLAVPGRPSTGGLHRALKDRIPGYDPGDSALEAWVIRLLVKAGLPLPSQQIRVRRPNGSVAFIDLGYPEHRIAIEVDGWSAHGGRGAFDRDRLRGNDLIVLGWRLLRFTSTTPEATIVQTVRAALGIEWVA